MPKPPTTNVSLRLPTSLVERIDAAATQAGVSRTEYMTSWLPVKYDSNAKTSNNDDNDSGRVASRRGESSPARVD